MREIKFRAWDKDEEEMIYSDKVPLDYDFTMNDKGCVICYSNCSYCDTFGDEHDDWKELDNIMQSTGLHDKNYAEVYEGDILKHTYEKFNDEQREWEEHIKNYVVEWHSSMASCGYRFRNGRNIFPVKQGTLFNGKAEIIGNIYENPELLEVTK